MAATRFDSATLQELKDLGVLSMKDCFNCGSCTGICPLSKDNNRFPRTLMRHSQLGLIDFENENVWACATCRSCADQCPRDVDIIDLMKSLRKIVVQMGAGYMPKPLHRAMVNIASVGNPFGEPAEKRGVFATELGVKPFAKGTELLLFMCCYSYYDSVARRTAIAVVNILKAAGVDFGILGTEESCCGESVNKAGNEELFQKLAEKNICTFNEKGVTRIVTISPHCYQTFANEYPKLGGKFEVLHYTQYLAQLIKEGKLKLVGEPGKKVTYHDSCYLGRHNGIYDEPREVLSAIPGLELSEMPYSQKVSFCCGGGGGRIWQETKKEDRISDLRLQQAKATGADILAVACPYCMVNLEDSRLVNNENIMVEDVAELVWQATYKELT